MAAEKILVVDDSSQIREILTENILKSAEYQVLSAKNGYAGLEITRKEKPDLVLLDIRMPVMDGFETIKKIRADHELEDLKVYAMTAQAMLDDFEIIKQNGFDDLITKPIDNSTLSFKIQQRIQQIKVM